MKTETRIIGGHVSIAGGFKEAPARAAAIGGNALQMFSGSPRGWNLPKIAPAEAEAYREAAKKCGIEAAYFHTSYLVNLADDGFIGDRSVDTLIAELKVAEKLGVRGSIIHLGSFKEGRPKIPLNKGGYHGGLFEAVPDTPPAADGTVYDYSSAPLIRGDTVSSYVKHERYDLLISNIKAVLEKSPQNTLFIIEDMGMRKIGRSLDEIAQIVKDVDDSRVKVCLDTCHLHVAGYDVSTKEKLDAFLKEFDVNIGLERLECFHINDSRDEFGSLRDRHENIGEGKVAKDVFKLVLNHPKLKHLPLLLEVPGFDDTGPDKKNVEILKSLVQF
ncbi:MAG: deoxyribonuclease IV [Patescibacteria group bacterium]